MVSSVCSGRAMVRHSPMVDAVYSALLSHSGVRCREQWNLLQYCSCWKMAAQCELTNALRCISLRFWWSSLIVFTCKHVRVVTGEIVNGANLHEHTQARIILQQACTHDPSCNVLKH
eukprot:6161484-Amphidinium_carterae.2